MCSSLVIADKDKSALQPSIRPLIGGWVSIIDARKGGCEDFVGRIWEYRLYTRLISRRYSRLSGHGGGWEEGRVNI